MPHVLGVSTTCPEEDFIFPGKVWARHNSPEEAGYSAEGLEKARKYAESLQTTGLVVVVGGKILLEYGDIEQLSYIASVRKSVLAMLYGNYVADGTIKLDTTLKELGIDDNQGLLPVEQNATIDHLITARSGIYHPASNGGDSSADAPPRGSQKPGEYFLYNNWDFNCAGFIFEKLTGKNIYDAVADDLANPLGMQDWDRSQQRKSGNLKRSRYPAYHMWYSTRDMARLGYLMLRKGEWKGRQIIPRDWAQKIVRVVTPLDEMNPSPLRKGRLAYGTMWWLWSGPKASGPFEGAYSARGAYGQYITVLPVLDLVIAHKTAVPPERSVNMIEYAGILNRIIAARNQ
jgi:CubicO group peptidase (beta-lactamase class C family)